MRILVLLSARAICSLLWGSLAVVDALAATTSAAQLADLTLEQLTNIEITAVSRRAERLSDAAGSVYVISADDIRRSGATSLAEVLRLAPNLHVARADANQYAISARGFNSTTANKLLTLVDGRTVYSPLFSGVFWEERDILLEDVERIEVMSGSGGTAWGSNAVNGFINVITKQARDTQGSLVSVGAGSQDSRVGVRYGGQTGNGVYYRVYGRTSTRDDSVNAAGGTIRDASRKARAGFRTDWGTAAQGFTLQGDVYSTEIDQGVAPMQRELSGINLLGRMTRDLGDGSGLRVQAYYDRTERDQPGSVREALDTFDIEFQHAPAPWGRHEFLWGGGYRMQLDRLVNLGPVLAFLPPDRNLRLSNAFVQDEIALRPNLDLTLGLKLEHNVYTGTEYLPNARLAWKLGPESLLWAAVSRTVRTPSRIDRELYIPATPPYLALAGGPEFRSETARVYELGYRARPSAEFSYSATVFHHVFDQLRSIEPTPAGPQFQNRIEGHNTGVEAWAKYQVASWWRLTAGAMFQDLLLRPKAGSVAIGGVATLGNDPNHTWSLGSSFDIGPQVELDLQVRRVGALPSPVVPAYTAVDARLGWRVRNDLELSVSAQNLFDPQHAEWGVAPGRPVFERAIFFKLLWRL